MGSFSVTGVLLGEKLLDIPSQDAIDAADFMRFQFAVANQPLHGAALRPSSGWRYQQWCR